MHGVRAVRGAEDSEALRSALEELFLPIAPTLQIFASTDPAPPAPEALLPADTSGLELVAWQHQGFGFASPPTMYRSARLNRPGPDTGTPRFGVLLQMIDATPYRGKRVKLAGSAKMEASSAGDGQVQLWLRVDRPDQEMGFFDNMDDRPITSDEWAMYEIEEPIADDASRIAFGGFLLGDGEARLDGFRLLVDDGSGSWTTVPVTNSGFENGSADGTPAGWGIIGERYHFSSVSEGAVEGARAARIVSGGGEVLTQGVFSVHPPAGEVLTRPIGRGLTVQLPIALFSRDDQTLGANGEHPTDALYTAPRSDRSGCADPRRRGATARGRDHRLERPSALLPEFRRG